MTAFQQAWRGAFKRTKRRNRKDFKKMRNRQARHKARVDVYAPVPRLNDWLCD